MGKDLGRLVITRKNKTNSFEQEKFSSVKSKDGLFLYISLRLIQIYSDGVFSLYILLPSFILALHV